MRQMQRLRQFVRMHDSLGNWVLHRLERDTMPRRDVDWIGMLSGLDLKAQDFSVGKHFSVLKIPESDLILHADGRRVQRQSQMRCYAHIMRMQYPGTFHQQYIRLFIQLIECFDDRRHLPVS